jgi:acylphosphatase
MDASDEDSLMTLRVIILGDVQGVGFRAWTMQQARLRALSGWVRNRGDGSVEALFSGPAVAVEDMVEACRHGPRYAEVHSVRSESASPPDSPAFRLLPDV